MGLHGPRYYTIDPYTTLYRVSCGDKGLMKIMMGLVKWAGYLKKGGGLEELVPPMLNKYEDIHPSLFYKSFILLFLRFL